MMRWLRPAWLVVALGALAWAGWQAWSTLGASDATGAAPGVARLVLATTCFAAHTALAAIAWAVLARGAAPHVAISAHVGDFLVSAPGKYLPGGVWMAVSRIGALGRHGVTAATASVLVLLEQLFALASLAALAAVAGAMAGTAAGADDRILRVAHLAIWVVGGIGLAYLAWRLRRSGANRLWNRSLAQAAGVALVLTVVSHLPFVAGYLCLILPAAGDLPALAPRAASAVLTGTLGGFLTPIAPGGIGVREGLIAALAGHGSSLASVALGVLAARAILIGIEFLAFAACVFGPWRIPRTP